jgi:hypothetical protein
MFTFNKNDIIQIHKTEDEAVIGFEYRNMRTCESYCSTINLACGTYYIDTYDAFRDYLQTLEDAKKNPLFVPSISGVTGEKYINIIFPFTIPYKKSSSDIVIKLPADYSCGDSQIELLNKKIKLLEKKIADDFVIPFCSVVASTDLTSSSSDEEILKVINEKAIVFCREQYYIDNATSFKFANYDGVENDKTKLIMLFDDKDELLIKYGCNYVCHIEAGKYQYIELKCVYSEWQIKITRIPSHKIRLQQTKLNTYGWGNNLRVNVNTEERKKYCINMFNTFQGIDRKTENRTMPQLIYLSNRFASDCDMLHTEKVGISFNSYQSMAGYSTSCNGMTYSEESLILKFDEEYKTLNIIG